MTLSYVVFEARAFEKNECTATSTLKNSTLHDF